MTQRDTRKCFAGIFLQKYIFALLAVLLCAFASVVHATPAIPVDIDKFSYGNTVTASYSLYGVKAAHTGYKEDDKQAKIFYTRKGTADPAQPIQLLLGSKQELEGAAQEMEIVIQPYAEMNRYAGQKLERFYRKATGKPGKKMNVKLEYTIPKKARLLVATITLKDYYKAGNKVLPRYTIVEYELTVAGAAANAGALSNKKVTKVHDEKGKRIIVENKGTDLTLAAIGIGGSLAAAFVYWLIYKIRGKKPERPNKEAPGNRAEELLRNTERPKFCSNCGARLEPGSLFCAECGEKVL